IRASGLSPPMVTSKSPARAADSRPIAHPANIPGTPSSPARRRVGTRPTAQSAMTIATASARNPAYRLTAPCVCVVIVLGFANRGQRFPHQVVQAADDADGDAPENAPRTRAELAIDPVPDQRQAGGRAGELQTDAGIPHPA